MSTNPAHTVIKKQNSQKNVTTNVKNSVATTAEDVPASIDMGKLREMEATITEQRREIARLRKEKAEAASMLEKLLAMLRT